MVSFDPSSITCLPTLNVLPLSEQKEKAKADKAAKFAAKQAAAKVKQPKAAAPSAPKAAKVQAPALPEYKDETPAGEKKVIQSFDHPHFQAYNPKAVESAWYTWWEKSGFFQPRPARSDRAGKKFVIPLPPPNVTGALHCGHALANSLQDTMIRWYRMK